MAVPLTHVDIERPEALTPRQFAQALNAALRQGARHYLLHDFGKHFKDVPENQPGGGYGVKPRSAKYLARKRRRKGHTIHNLLTERTRNAMRNSGLNGGITATSTRGARLKMRGAFPMRLQMRRELEAMTAEEKRTVMGVVVEHVDQAAAEKIKIRKRVRIS